MTIAELRELVARATPGPWYWQRGGMTGCSYNVRGSKDYGEPCVMCSDGEHNARLITEALRALPALLAVAEWARDFLEGHDCEGLGPDVESLRAAIARLGER